MDAAYSTVLLSQLEISKENYFHNDVLHPFTTENEYYCSNPAGTSTHTEIILKLYVISHCFFISSYSEKNVMNPSWSSVSTMSLINHKNIMNNKYSRKPVIIPYDSLKLPTNARMTMSFYNTVVSFTHTNYCI